MAGDVLVALVGAKPPEGWRTLNDMGIPFVLLADEADPVDTVVGAVSVHRTPFKANPFAVLDCPVPSSVQRVFSFTELGLLPAAILSEALGLPTVSVAAVLKTRNKAMMRRALDDRVCQPEFGRVGVDEPTSASFPLILKPVDGSGSRGVDFVPEAHRYAAASADRAGFLWESYIRGAEYSVEAVSADGKHHILGITEKHTSGPPYFIETGHTAPAVLPTETDSAVRKCVCMCLDQLGVTSGPSHTEVKVDGDRAYLIEVHTRPGGDRIPMLTRLVTGHDQYRLAVEVALFNRITEHRADTCHPVAGVRYFPWQDTVLRAVTGMDACMQSDGVVEAHLDVRPGSRIPLWRYSHERPGYVLAYADSRSELEERLTYAQQRVVPEFAEAATSGRC